MDTQLRRRHSSAPVDMNNEDGDAVEYVYYENTPLGDYLSCMHFFLFNIYSIDTLHSDSSTNLHTIFTFAPAPAIGEDPSSIETSVKTLPSSHTPFMYHFLGKGLRKAFKAIQFLSKTAQVCISFLYLFLH
jgi:hypothetical protein